MGRLIGEILGWVVGAFILMLVSGALFASLGWVTLGYFQSLAVVYLIDFVAGRFAYRSYVFNELKDSLKKVRR